MKKYLTIQALVLIMIITYSSTPRNTIQYNELVSEVHAEQRVVNLKIITTPVKNITYKEVYSMPDNEYMVLFTDTKCKYCVELWDNYIDKYKETGTKPLYVVNLEEGTNNTAWTEYDIAGIPLIIEFGDTLTKYTGLKETSQLITELIAK